MGEVHICSCTVSFRNVYWSDTDKGVSRYLVFVSNGAKDLLKVGISKKVNFGERNDWII